MTDVSEEELSPEVRELALITPLRWFEWLLPGLCLGLAGLAAVVALVAYAVNSGRGLHAPGWIDVTEYVAVAAIGAILIVTGRHASVAATVEVSRRQLLTRARSYAAFAILLEISVLTANGYLAQLATLGMLIVLGRMRRFTISRDIPFDVRSEFSHRLRRIWIVVAVLTLAVGVVAVALGFLASGFDLGVPGEVAAYWIVFGTVFLPVGLAGIPLAMRFATYRDREILAIDARNEAIDQRWSVAEGDSPNSRA